MKLTSKAIFKVISSFKLKTGRFNGAFRSSFYASAAAVRYHIWKKMLSPIPWVHLQERARSKAGASLRRGARVAGPRNRGPARRARGPPPPPLPGSRTLPPYLGEGEGGATI